MADSPLLTVPEMARFLRVDARTVRRMLERGELAGAHVGRQWRIDTTGTLMVANDDRRKVL